MTNGKAKTHLSNISSPEGVVLVPGAQSSNKGGHGGTGSSAVCDMSEKDPHQSKTQQEKLVCSRSCRASSAPRQTVSKSRTKSAHRFLKLGRIFAKTDVRRTPSVVSPMSLGQIKDGKPSPEKKH